ncbi:MAG: CARDB domain-containing protein [Planctomycetota bacterium]
MRYSNVVYMLMGIGTLLATDAATAQSRLRQLRDRLDRGRTAEQRDSRDSKSGPSRNQGQKSPSGGSSRTTDPRQGKSLAKVDWTVTAIRGGDDALMATIQNLGFTTAPATDVQIIVKDRITGVVRATKNTRVGQIEAGKVARVRMQSLPLGNSITFVTVDPFGRVAEGNETNNFRSATFNAPNVSPNPNDRADLIVSGLQARGNQLLVQVTNAGRAPSTAAQVNIVVRGRDGRLLKTTSVRVRPLKIGHIAQMYVRNLVLDDVKVVATVDPENRVPERNERNNVKELSIGNQTQFAPDLIITNIQFKRQRKEVWYTVRNVGPVAQKQDVSLTVKSYFGPGNLVERSAKRVSRLNSGQSVALRWNVAQLNSGMQFEGVLDVSNRLPEQNEGNNRKVVTFN